MPPSSQQNYQTASLDVAACLIAAGIELIETKQEGRRGVFVFRYAPQIDEIETAILNRTYEANVALVFAARRDLFDRVNAKRVAA